MNLLAHSGSLFNKILWLLPIFEIVFVHAQEHGLSEVLTQGFKLLQSLLFQNLSHVNLYTGKIDHVLEFLEKALVGFF